MATAHLTRLRDSRATVLGSPRDDSETFAIEILRTGELVIDGLTREDARAKARSMNTGATVEELVVWRREHCRLPDVTKRSDAQLMRGTSEGCHESFEEIVRRYRRLVLYHANRMLRDEFAADDVSQEVLLTLLTKAGDFDSNRKSASAWIIGIKDDPMLVGIKGSRLLLSYASRDQKPSPSTLHAAGLQLVEDYEHGSFLLVEPEGNITAETVDALLADDAVVHAAPDYSMSVAPVPPSEMPSPRVAASTSNDPLLNQLCCRRRRWST